MVINPSYAQSVAGEPDRNSSAPTVADATAQSPGKAENLGSEAALSRNLALYESGQYQNCARGLEDWLRSVSDASPAALEQVDQAKIYLGACLIASGQVEKADQVFGDAIRGNPQMRAPDSLVFPQTVVDRFLRVREQLLSDIRRDERSRVQDAENHAKEQDAKRKRELLGREKLKLLATEETIVEKNRRWLASVPFGVGQFQNGDNAAGWAFLVTEVALAGTCITALVIDEKLANRAREPGIDLTDLRAKRLDTYRVIVGTSWGFLGVAAGGILHANWRFVPERRTTRRRPLPPDLAQSAGESQRGLRPERSPAKGPEVGVVIGPFVGITGTF